MLNLKSSTTLFKSLVVSGLLLSALAPQAHAQDAAEKGYEIAKRSDESDRGFKDHKVKMQMILRNAAGQEDVRDMRFSVKEEPNLDLGDKSLIIFDTPKDISGSALLSHAKILEPDDQWLFIPEDEMIKRISSRNKSGPFFGSEFAYEDFTAQELNKYKYKYLRQEACPNVPELTCDVVERYPQYERSGYARQIGWVDTTDFQNRKIEFYNRADSLIKSLDFLDYKQYEGKFWRPHLMKMVNHQTGKSTDLVYGPYSFDNGLTENDFVKGVLETLY